MVVEIKLVKKVKRLLRRVGLPRWLHRFGPKTYEFREHVQALLVMSMTRHSFRSVVALLDLLGLRCPSKSALQYTLARIPAALWQRLLAATAKIPYIAAMDSTGFSRSNPSYYYLRRIDGSIPRVGVKLSAIVDTQRKRFIAAVVRVLAANDNRDAPALIQRSKARIIVADKGYDSETNHRIAFERGMLSMIPTRRNVRRGQHRHKQLKHFKQRTYNRRSMIEAAFSAIKRKYGSSIHCCKARTIRAEVYLKLINHNISSTLLRLLGQSPQA